MRRERLLVLGGGISSLAYLFYHPDAYALAADVGGMFAQKILGPTYLWSTPQTRRLYLDSFRSSAVDTIPTRVVRIGCLLDGKVMSMADVDGDRIRTAYSMKTRGTEPRDSHMSDGVSEFEVIDVPLSEIVERLVSAVRFRIIRGVAEAVDSYRGIVTARGGIEFPYDHLVSTIPAPILLWIMGRADEAETLVGYDKMYVSRKPLSDLEYRFLRSEFDYAYAPGSEHLYHRITRDTRSPGNIIAEYTHVPGSAVIPCPEGAHIHRAGQIVSGKEILRLLPPSIQLLGRYAEWDQGVRTEDVLEEIGC